MEAAKADSKPMAQGDIDFKPKAEESLAFACSHKKSQAIDHSDILEKVDRLVDARTTEQVFDLYMTKVATHCPVVVFPSGTTMRSIRDTKPVLYLAVLASAVGDILPREKQIALWDEMMNQYAISILREGEKSLEMVHYTMAQAVRVL